MQTNKIYFQKSFNVAEFLYEHYGVEILLEPGETVDEAFKKAKDIVWEQVEKNHPVFNSNNGKAIFVSEENLPVIDYNEK